MNNNRTIYDFLILLSLLLTVGVTAMEDVEDEEQLSANLFTPPPEIKVLAPSQFPEPPHLITEGPPGVTVVAEPVFGHHRPGNVHSVESRLLDDHGHHGIECPRKLQQLIGIQRRI